MKIVKRLLDCPLSKEKIKDTPGLENLSIVKNPCGTNFPVTLAEWDIVKQLIEE